MGNSLKTCIGEIVALISKVSKVIYIGRSRLYYTPIGVNLADFKYSSS